MSTSLVRRAGLLIAVGVVLTGSSLSAQGPLRKIGELELAVVGLSASVTPANPVVPKNTPAGVRIVVRSGAGEVPSGDLTRFFGAGVHVEADYSGPGLSQTLALTSAGEADRLLLKLPAVQTSGNYHLSNVRLVANQRSALDVTPQGVGVQVIEQVLITSVTTRPLTLDEIKSRGIVLDRDDYLGFEFTMGVLIESRPVQVKFPVVFTANGTPLPEFTFATPQVPSPQLDLPNMPMIMPMMLIIEAPGGGQIIPRLADGTLVDVKIPGVLVIPGNVGYLKQFFSAQLFVANGAPGGSGLTVHDLTGTIRLPAGDDHERGTADDPLSLARVDGGLAPATLGVVALGPDGAAGTGDDLVSLRPGEQGQAEFLIRGDQEGFHAIDFDIAGVLDGLATGPATVKGRASGAVLVRNPYFDVTFTVPSVVRTGERFKIFATITNKSEGSPANDLTLSFDPSRMSGMRLHVDETGARQIDTLRAGDSKTFQFDFVSERTGQVVASYLRFHTATGSNGTIRFTAGVGERGVALSPDTLVLPASVDALPPDVVEAAMRVIGQAWSISLATDATRPAGVLPITRSVALAKGVALAEAGLRTTLGQPLADSLRDFVLDFYGPAESALNAGSLDPGFDQLLRTTEAGHALRRALGSALRASTEASGGAVTYQRAWAELLASGSNRITFATSGGPADVTLVDAAGLRTEGATSAVILPVSDASDAPVLGVVTQPLAGPYTLALSGRAAGTTDLAVSVTRADGTTARGLMSGLTLTAGRRALMHIDPSATDPFTLEEVDDEGAVGGLPLMLVETLLPGGAHLVSANVIGPETFSSASPLGKHTVLMFDRPVDPQDATDGARYAVPKNHVLRAARVLSGRFVIVELEQPEGRFVPTSLAVSAMADLRGVRGPATEQPLHSLVRDMGAVVSGRVFSADGVGVGGLEVFYSNVYSDGDCEFAGNQFLFYLAKVRTEADGSYLFRYVRRDTVCNAGFQLTAQDPQSGSVRKLFRHVQADGERIVLDLGLFGRGTITGLVRDLNGQPVGGAQVVVFSRTDEAIQESALTDGTGRYTIPGVLVGPVSVVARKAYDNGATVRQGTSGGNLTRAGGTAPIDVVVNTASASVSGMVTQIVDGVSQPAGGALVIYELQTGATNRQTVAGQFSGPDGRFSFPAVPVGVFFLDVTFNAALTLRGSATGLVAVGERLEGFNVVLQTPQVASIRGRVRLADGTSVAGAMVRMGEGATFTDASGAFEISQIEVKPSEPQSISAETPDRRRGVASVLVTHAGIIENVVITLSALGSVELTVLDPAGAPIADQSVDILADQFGLRGACALGCGCSLTNRVTDAFGRVRFDGLAAGVVRARATRTAGGFRSVADGRATIISEGHLARGVMRFEGFGSITGIVLDPEGRPAVGADLSVSSRQMDPNSCAMMDGRLSHSMRTDAFGRFALSSVGVGPVSIRASQAFLPTPVAEQLTITRPGESREVTLRLVDTFAGELSGRVLLPDGVTRAGSGVEVTINGPLPDITVRTNAEGHFRFAKILPAGTYVMTVIDSVTAAVARQNIHLEAGQDFSHDVRLKGRGTVRIRVVDALDAPVTGVIVKLQETEYPNRLREALADESTGGTVTFEQVFEGPLVVDVTDVFARGGRASATLPAPGSTIDVKVRISVTGTVQGRFLLPDETPIPYGVVRLLANDREIGQATTSGTGDVGAFEFLHVPAGPLRLEAQDPASARTGIAAGRLTSEGELLPLDVHAQGLGTVTGVVTAGGAPQAGAKVELVSGPFSVSAVADGEGRYAISGVPEGQVSVGATLPSEIQTGSASGTLVGDGTVLQLDVAVRDAGRLTGVVLPAGSGQLPQAIVTANAGGALTFTAVTDAEGRFVFERLPAGHIRLTAQVIGSIDTGRLEIDLPGSQTTDVQLTLRGVGAIRGRALDSNGTPTSGALTLNGTGLGSYSISLTIGVDGLFQFPELLAGPVTLTLASTVGTSRLYGSASAVVAPEEETAIDVQLQDSATITGRVVHADGATAAIGAEATISMTASSSVIPVQVQTDGLFTATGVPLGAFVLRITDPFTGGVARVSDRATVVNGEIVDLGTIVLDDAPVQVTSVSPPDGATAIAVNREVSLTFSDPLQSTSGISVVKGTTTISSTVSLAADGRSVTLRAPGTSTWPDAAELTVVVETTATDIYGRHPAQSFSSRFYTVDLSPPHVASLTPADAAVHVAAGASIDVIFNEPLAPATNLATLIAMTGSGSPVQGTTEQTGLAAVRFTPAAPLADNAIYVVSVNGAVDASGNTQTVPQSFSFTTHDTVPPTLSLVSPKAWTNQARPSIQVDIADATSGISPGSGHLALDGGELAVPSSVIQLSASPPAALAEASHTISASVADRAGNVSTLDATFAIDLTPPGQATLSGVTDGAVVAGSITIAATASDALSGVARIDLLRNGVLFTSLTAPSYQVTVHSSVFGEGRHTLTASAVDVAGNIGAAGPAVVVLVDNQPLTMRFDVPLANAATRSTIVARALPSEAVVRVEFVLGGLTVIDAVAPYEVTLDTTSVPEGTQTLTARGIDQFGLTATATVPIVIDRTAPSAPDASRMSAEPPVSGASLVLGGDGAVEPNAAVGIVNLANSASATTVADTSGAFSASVAAAVDDLLSLTATDQVGNRSAATTVAVRRTPSLPAGDGAAMLQFDGVLADRVSAGTGGAALVPDGVNDALFRLSIAANDGLTRHLSFIQLDNEDAGTKRSTEPGASGIVGVAMEAGGAFINQVDGRVSADVASTVTFSLLVHDGGFISSGATYRATAVFADGSRFAGRVRIVPPADRTQVVHAARIVADAPTVTVIAPGVPGTTLLTLTDIRDIDGTRVPDGARVALSAANLASTDPRGNSIVSAGGLIEGGEPAANHTAFRVFTIAGGTVTATYSSGALSPPATTGAHVVVQMLAADEQNNVLGQQAAATLDLNVRAAADQAMVHIASPGSLYADTVDRRIGITVFVRTATGAPVADGTRVFLIPNGGGAIVGGSPGAYVPFTVNGGRVDAQYSAAGVTARLADSPPAKTITIQAHPANTSGFVITGTILGTAQLVLVPAASAEFETSPASVPWVFPERSAQVVIHHVHDLRGNLVPDAASFLVTASASAGWKYRGVAIASFGGSITDGTPSSWYGTDYRMFAIDFGRIAATYAASQSGSSVPPGEDRIARVSVSAAQPNGFLVDTFNREAVGVGKLIVVAPANAIGSANPVSVLGDGALRTSTVTFAPVLDAFGNPLPDGSNVLVSATGTFQTRNANGTLASFTSWGGQVVNGVQSSGNTGSYKILTVQNGAVTVVYGTPSSTTLGVGQTRTAYVALVEYPPPGSFAPSPVLGLAPIKVTGATSATGAASPAAVFADGANRRTMATFSNFRDALGELVPDGAKVIAKLATGSQGSIANGALPPSGQGGMVFTITNGQIVVEYSAQGAFGSSTASASIQVFTAQPSGYQIDFTPLATVTVQLIAPTASGVVAFSPTSLLADDGNRQAYVTVTGLRDSAGNPVPDDAKVVLGVSSPAGDTPLGVPSSAGVSPGDGTLSPGYGDRWSFTVANGEVRAIYTGTGVYAGAGVTKTRSVNVYPGRSDGSLLTNTVLTSGSVSLHGMTFATGNGPASAPRNTGTTVTFSGIKDKVGNLVPDGAKVIVQVMSCRVSDGFCQNGSAGTFTNGATAGAANERLYTVVGGSVEVTFQTGGSSGWRAQFYAYPARLSGDGFGSTNLTGGVWTITVTP